MNECIGEVEVRLAHVRVEFGHGAQRRGGPGVVNAVDHADGGRRQLAGNVDLPLGRKNAGYRVRLQEETELLTDRTQESFVRDRAALPRVVSVNDPLIESLGE